VSWKSAIARGGYASSVRSGAGAAAVAAALARSAIRAIADLVVMVY